MATCPICNGARGVFTITCGRPTGASGEELKCQPGMKPCFYCDGSGAIDDLTMERYRRGRALRELRVHQLRVTQEQLARILRCGVTGEEINAIEQGRTEMPEGFKHELNEFLKEKAPL
jgi:DNA-binding XRE family transcriptional regulator